MKEALKSIGILFYFIICQCMATFGIMFFKAYTDPQWILALAQYSAADIFSEGYLALIWEILYPALIAADIIIIVPMLIKAKKDKQKLFKPIKTYELKNIVLLGIVLNFIISFIVNLIPASISSNYNELMSMIITDNFIMTLITTGILAPIMEEFVFRYALIEIFSKKGTKVAIIISSLMFGLAHFQIIQSTYAFVLGLLLGYMYVKEKNLLKPIILHIVINSTSVMYEYASSSLRIIMLICVAISFILLIPSIKKNIDKKEFSMI